MPVSGKYRIKAAGAGNEENNTFGAVIKCSINLQEAQVLQIAIGQCAQSKKCGSGGTFVALFNEAAEVTWKPLVVAGGAGGAIKFRIFKIIFKGLYFGAQFGIVENSKLLIGKCI